MYRIQITKGALKDLEAAEKWYNKKRTALGFELLEEVNSHLNLLQQNPQIFPCKYYPYHEFPLKRFPYIITYII